MSVRIMLVSQHFGISVQLTTHNNNSLSGFDANTCRYLMSTVESLLTVMSLTDILYMEPAK